MSSFDLKRPCPACPFLKAEGGVRGLRPERIRSIVESDGGFVCHRTSTETANVRSGSEQECAGFLIHHLANGSAPQMMRIAGRLGMIDADELLKAEGEVFTDVDEMIEAHEFK